MTSLTELYSPDDQASGLRRLFERRVTRVIAVASAQHGGARLSDRIKVIMQLADDILKSGRSLTLLDEHPGAGGTAYAYGVVSGKDFKHALHGDYPLDEVMFSPVAGLRLIPAPRAAGMEFNLADEAALAGNLALLRSTSDCIIIDSAHRVRRALSPLSASADQLLVVVTASDSDLTRAYGLIKRAAHEKSTLPIAIVVTQATDAKHAKSTYDKLRRVAHDHLGIRLHYQGAALASGVRHLTLMQPLYISPSDRADISQMDNMMHCKGMANSMV